MRRISRIMLVLALLSAFSGPRAALSSGCPLPVACYSECSYGSCGLVPEEYAWCHYMWGGCIGGWNCDVCGPGLTGGSLKLSSF